MVFYIISLGATPFFLLDPLAALASTIAARALISSMIMALFTVVITLMWGRVWCGWICPLGTLLDWIRFPRTRERALSLSPHWKTVKYLILFFILTGALFGSLTLMILDPITILTQTLATVVLPVLKHIITDLGQVFSSSALLPTGQFIFVANLFFIVMFTTIIVLNAIADRFWCRYLCPLGGLLALLSKIAFLRQILRPQCNHCGDCVVSCPMDAIAPERNYEIDPGECTVCADCIAVCSQNALGVRYAWQPTWREYDPGRRQILLSLAAGAVGTTLLRVNTRAKQRISQAIPLLRPPGVEDEELFLSRCIRCGECLKQCPTSALQPIVFEAGLEKIGTPRFVPRLGYCDYDCKDCSKMCPTNAIPRLDLDRKRQAVIGKAAINRDHCLPWAHGIPCTVCQEVCPLPENAIRLEEVTVTDDRGKSVVVQRPYVLQDLCTGCGYCENKCPVKGESAIRIYP